MSRLPPELTFDLVNSDEVSVAFGLEVAGFPADEVTPVEQFRLRQEQAPTLFIGAFIPSSAPESRRTIIGFACATRYALPTYTAASMKGHDPEGTSVCIHNVVVSTAYRLRGIALALVGEIIAQVRNDGLTKRVLLICHDNLRPLYRRAGFVYVRHSPIVLGRQQWIEMHLTLNGPSNSSDDTLQRTNGAAKSLSNVPAPAPQCAASPHSNGLIKVLQQPSASCNGTSARRLPSFAACLDDATADLNGVKTNKYDILCSRTGCGSIVLKAYVGRLAEKELLELEPKGQPRSSLLASLPSAGTSILCWLVQSNPAAFENIGFSRSVDRGSESRGTGPKLELLCCANCEFGPIGLCIEDGNDFWLICSRVGYRA